MRQQGWVGQRRSSLASTGSEGRSQIGAPKREEMAAAAGGGSGLPSQAVAGFAEKVLEREGKAWAAVGLAAGRSLASKGARALLQRLEPL